jgi:hypothetical protein
VSLYQRTWWPQTETPQDGPRTSSSYGCPEPIPIDDEGPIDGEVYAAAANSFAGEMQHAVAPGG